MAALSQHSNESGLHSITLLISRSVVKRLPQRRIHVRMFEKANFRGHHGIIHNRGFWGQNAINTISNISPKCVAAIFISKSR